VEIVLIRCRSELGPRETNVSGVYPPLGLAYVAAALRQAGHDVTILDGEALRLTAAELLARIPRSAAIAGFTSSTLAWPTVRHVARLAKEQTPGRVLVLGGPHVTAFPEESLRAAPFDVGVLGDGEVSMVAIADRVSRGESLAGLASCAVRTADGIRTSPAIAWIQDLDSLPMPALDLLPMDRYRSIGVCDPFVTMISSRGCPFRCAFCSQIYSGDRLRTRSPEGIVEEMARAVKDYKVREIVLFDETFGVKRKDALRLCELIRERGLKFRWNARTRVDAMDEELLRALRSAGCYILHLGIESGTQRILDQMCKGITLDQVRSATRLARKLGFVIHAYFMIGYPGETREEVEATIRFSRELPLDWASFTVALPHPRTKLCDIAVREGRLQTGYWEQYTLGELPEGAEIPAFESAEFSADDLKKAKRRAYVGFYSRPAIAWKTARFFLSNGGWSRLAYAGRLWMREQWL
jgi:anaerobic magnesium-protoporphyrin IX monomethyl ester cyclase